MTPWRSLRLSGLIILACLLFRLIPTLYAQDAVLDVCGEVRSLMSQDATPYDTVSGGVLPSDTPLTVQFTTGEYSKFYSFNVTSFQTNPLQIRFDELSPGLEFALFRGMERVRPFEVIANNTYTQPLNGDGVYTLVVRHTSLAALNIPASVRVTATYPGDTDIEVPNLRDDTTTSPLSVPPRFEDGVTLISLTSANLRIHTGSATSVASVEGQAAQVQYGEAGSLLVGGWAQEIALLGGDLAAKGVTNGGQPRIFYLQDFGYRRNLTNENLNIEDSNGTRITLDWATIKGFWLLRECVGIELLDGRTFTSPIQPDTRQVTFAGNLDAMIVGVDSSNLIVDWNGVEAASEIRLADGLLNLQLIGNKSLLLQGSSITVDRRTPPEGETLTPETPLDIELFDRGATLTLDWANMASFALLDDTLILGFTDVPRGTVTRSAADLVRFEALDDVIAIAYEGEQRLLLPAEDNYIEIITPPGNPPFNPLALPDEAGYAPRGLNNLGGECYTVNTTLPQANCPPNGHPNPANGNLWYSVTDHQASGGYGLDLTLTRSYNSSAASVDSPFGYGWTTEYLLDYNVAYDAEQGSRPVTPQTVAVSRMGLDVTYAPRGIVTLTTGSGSRHVFAGEGDTLTAITMPGWRLSRTDLRSNWTLQQPDGLTTQFDRAGRILSYGYPQNSRLVTIEYPRDGTATITDAAEQRQLELYYDEVNHITRSVLRDMTRSTIYETNYVYEDGLLTGVIYPDGQTATYQYDQARRLIAHDDPRAPISPRMRYTYTGDHLTTIMALDADTEAVWRTLTQPQVDDDERRVTVTDEWGASRTYTYRLAANTRLREPGAAYTLVQVSSPLPEGGDIDALPERYLWEDGLLTRIEARIRGTGGRNSTILRYTPGGALQSVAGNFLDFDLITDAQTVTARFADDTAQTYELDERGLPILIRERQGAEYTLAWDERGWLESRTRTNDDRTWTYTHNVLGLIDSVTTGTHTTRYRYDGLGRLTEIDDALLGIYTIQYIGGDIVITDAFRTQTRLRFDGRGRLIESRLSTRTNAALRRTTYQHDLFDRPAGETVNADQSLTTGYTPTATLTEADGTIIPINGYTVTRTDATIVYDAYGRVRQTSDALRRVTRYDYLTSNTRYTNGLRIIGRELRGDTLISTTEYAFDLAGQLRGVSRTVNDDTISWTLNTEGDPVQPRSLEAVGADVLSVFWNNFSGANATQVEFNPVAITLESGAVQPTMRLSTTYDFLERPTRTTDGGGVVTQTAYCPTADGGETVRVFAPGQEVEFPCNESASAVEKSRYDVHGRLVRVDDAFGTRTYTYTRDVTAQAWVVAVTFTEGEAQYTWELHYNAAGDLTEWTDDAGVVREYGHDGAGRLTRVYVPDAPEASYTFTYNAAGGLTSQLDDIGRGFIYQYDEQGLLIGKQDVLTGDTTTYAYDAYGEMTSTISPLGNTTVFQYGDSSQITGVIDPSGALGSLVWDSENNRLVYSDVRGGETGYTFDALGLLWRVDDAAGQSHELHYDSAGQLRELLTAQPPAFIGGDAARTLTLTPLTDGMITISEVDQPEWSWMFGLNSTGALTNLTDPSGEGLAFGYDPLGRVSSAVTGEHAWRTVRSAGERALTLNGTRYDYDRLYRLTGKTAPDGTITRYDYGVGDENTTTLTVTGDKTRTYTFSPGDDSSQSRTVTLNAPGQAATYLYNAEGQIEEFRRDACIADDVTGCQPGDNTIFTTTVRFNYDAEGRPVRIIDQEQNIETFAYDDVGNLLSYQTANGKTFTYAYDTLNRLLAVTSPTGIKLLVGYDALDNVTGVCRTRAEAPNDFQICAEAGRTLETYTYDSLGRLLTQSFPNADGTATISHQYTDGRLTSWGAGDEQVVREYEPNALGLLSRLTISDAVYDFDYDFADVTPLLLQAGEDTYAYDGYGRVNRINEYTLDYADEGRGYTITREDEYAAYLLDERGFLAALDYGLVSAPNEIPLLGIVYRLNPRQPDVLSVIMTSNDNTKTLDWQLDRRGETRNLVSNYDDRRLLIDYITDPLGLVTRQRIDGSPEALFAEGAGGYILVTGYDDDNRPTTLRITDKGGGRLLYVQNFTYDEAGQRQTETRRYSDNTQMTITYEYGTPNQLTRRIVEIVRGTAQTSALPTVAALMMGIPFALLWRRRKNDSVVFLKTLLPFTAIALCLLMFSTLNAQAQTQTYTFDYIYDEAGNLVRIETPTEEADALILCRAHTYDSANRLTQLEEPDGITSSPEYDGFNRSLFLQYAGEQPFTNGTVFYGRLDNRPPLWLAAENFAYWQMIDGRDGVLLDAQAVTPIEILDPLGRPVDTQFAFGAVDETFDPCSLTEEHNSQAVEQPKFRELLHANLYLSPDGRTYDPLSGRTLQRNPRGLDALGNAYDLDQPQPVPAQRREGSPLSQGITALNDALTVTNSTDALNSDQIKQAYYPKVRRTEDWTAALATQDTATLGLQNLLTLPAWLQANYNLRGVELDLSSGALLLDVNSTPGQRESGNSDLNPSAESQNFMPTPPTGPLESVQSLFAFTDVQIRTPTSYDSRLWLSPARGRLPLTSTPTSTFTTPDAVLDRLPQPLSAPQNAADVLQLVQQLDALPYATGRDWLQRLVFDALPTLPQLPRTPDEHRQEWFTDDTLGTQQALQARQDVPTPPDVPVYGIGHSNDWLFLDDQRKMR